MKKGMSLTDIRAIACEQLKRQDIGRGELYLAEVTGILQSLREKLDCARNELFALAAKAATAQDTAELCLINDQTVSAACELFIDLNSVPMVQELCTVVRDAIAERALALARMELFFSGISCELPLSLLAVGSDGRREQLLFTDQDYLFLHGTGYDSSLQAESTTDYFEILGSVFSTKMEESGISRCSGGIMPVNDDWRGSQQQWQQRLTSMLRFEKNNWESDILNLIALMDTRFICGDHDLGFEFGKNVRRIVRDNPQALRQMARVVSSMQLSKGFIRRFIVEAEGIHKGEFNFKLLAWMPLVMCVRLLAVSVGVEETTTLGRIRCLQTEGHLTDKMANELIDAYHILTGHRIRQQIKKIKGIIDFDCYINPYELLHHKHEELKNAIDRISELQDMMRSRFAMATSADRVITSVLTVGDR